MITDFNDFIDGDEADLLFEPLQETQPLVAVITEEEREIRSLLDDVYVSDTNLARDIAYFGETDLEGILHAYAMTHNELKDKLLQKNFADMITKFRADMTKDAKGMLRARAGAYLDAALHRLNSIIHDPREKSENVLKAIHHLAIISDAIPKTSAEKGMGGVSVSFNFGANNPIIDAAKYVGVDNE